MYFIFDLFNFILKFELKGAISKVLFIYFYKLLKSDSILPCLKLKLYQFDSTIISILLFSYVKRLQNCIEVIWNDIKKIFFFQSLFLKFPVIRFPFLAKHLLTVRVSIVVSIPACHAGDRGSIPRHGEFFFLPISRTESFFSRLVVID